tara:strand:- start:6600 stop:11486 length:4887 start_codon:yes stop_codon:yes gene_type:complete
MAISRPAGGGRNSTVVASGSTLDAVGAKRVVSERIEVRGGGRYLVTTYSDGTDDVKQIGPATANPGTPPVSNTGMPDDSASAFDPVDVPRSAPKQVGSPLVFDSGDNKIRRVFFDDGSTTQSIIGPSDAVVQRREQEEAERESQRLLEEKNKREREESEREAKRKEDERLYFIEQDRKREEERQRLASTVVSDEIIENDGRRIRQVKYGDGRIEADDIGPIPVTIVSEDIIIDGINKIRQVRYSDGTIKADVIGLSDAEINRRNEERVAQQRQKQQEEERKRLDGALLAEVDEVLNEPPPTTAPAPPIAANQDPNIITTDPPPAADTSPTTEPSTPPAGMDDYLSATGVGSQEVEFQYPDVKPAGGPPAPSFVTDDTPDEPFPTVPPAGGPPAPEFIVDSTTDAADTTKSQTDFVPVNVPANQDPNVVTPPPVIEKEPVIQKPVNQDPNVVTYEPPPKPEEETVVTGMADYLAATGVGSQEPKSPLDGSVKPGGGPEQPSFVTDDKADGADTGTSVTDFIPTNVILNDEEARAEQDRINNLRDKERIDEELRLENERLKKEEEDRKRQEEEKRQAEQDNLYQTYVSAIKANPTDRNVVPWNTLEPELRQRLTDFTNSPEYFALFPNNATASSTPVNQDPGVVTLDTDPEPSVEVSEPVDVEKPLTEQQILDTYYNNFATQLAAYPELELFNVESQGEFLDFYNSIGGGDVTNALNLFFADKDQQRIDAENRQKGEDAIREAALAGDKEEETDPPPGLEEYLKFTGVGSQDVPEEDKSVPANQDTSVVTLDDQPVEEEVEEEEKLDPLDFLPEIKEKVEDTSEVIVDDGDDEATRKAEEERKAREAEEAEEAEKERQRQKDIDDANRYMDEAVAKRTQDQLNREAREAEAARAAQAAEDQKFVELTDALRGKPTTAVNFNELEPNLRKRLLDWFSSEDYLKSKEEPDEEVITDPAAELPTGSLLGDLDATVYGGDDPEPEDRADVGFTFEDYQAELEKIIADSKIKQEEREKRTRIVTSDFVDSLKGRVTEVLNDLDFDSESYEEDQLAALEADYEESKARLARQFGIDPGGAKTGRAARSFELLEADRIQKRAAVRQDVANRLEASLDRELAALNDAFQFAVDTEFEEKKLDQANEQFQKTLETELTRLGLSEIQVAAAVKQINSEILNTTRATSASIGQDWAAVTGKTGTASGKVNVSDLGISLDYEDILSGFLPTTTAANKRFLVSSSFEALIGRLPTSKELARLMNGEDVEIDSMPTLESRKIAAEVTQQNMERFAKYAAIADETGLARDKFEQAQNEYNDAWALTTGNVAEEFGLDPVSFSQAQYMLDGMNNKLFFDDTLTPEERAQKVQENEQLVTAKFFVSDADKVAFRQASSLFARTIGDQQNALARAYNTDAETFRRAQQQVQDSEDRFLGVWGSLVEGTSEQLELVRPDDTGFSELDKVNDPVVRQRYVDFVLSPIVQQLSADGIIDSADITRDDVDPMVAKLFSGDYPDLVEDLRKHYETYFSTYLFPDVELRATIKNNLEGYALANMEGALPRLYSGARGIPRDWFSKIDNAETQQAILSLIGGAYGGTPEREQSSLLGSIGNALGIGAGALIGGALSGGNPAGISAGASAGNALTK